MDQDHPASAATDQPPVTDEQLLPPEPAPGPPADPLPPPKPVPEPERPAVEVRTRRASPRAWFVVGVALAAAGVAIALWAATRAAGKDRGA